jgi:hypothetical protein
MVVAGGMAEYLSRNRVKQLFSAALVAGANRNRF